MSIALDIGVHRLRSLRRSGQQLVGRSSCAVYSVLDDEPSVREILDRIGVSYGQCEGSLLLIGDDAVNCSPAFHIPCVPLLPEGRVPRDDAPARQIIGSLVSHLLPKPAHADEPCCITLPGTSASRDNHERAFLSQLVRLQGYTPLPLTASMALILAELVDQSFTGIGFVMGASSCQMSLAHRGIEVANVTIPLGGNWIDSELARRENLYRWDARGNKSLDVVSVRAWKESESRSIEQPSDDRERFLGELYHELIAHVVRVAAINFANTRAVERIQQPVTLVAAGGAASIAGFSEVLSRAWKEASFPVNVEASRVVEDSEYTVARGCLIWAELEADMVQGKGRAVA